MAIRKPCVSLLYYWYTENKICISMEFLELSQFQPSYLYFLRSEIQT